MLRVQIDCKEDSGAVKQKQTFDEQNVFRSTSLLQEKIPVRVKIILLLLLQIQMCRVKYQDTPRSCNVKLVAIYQV